MCIRDRCVPELPEVEALVQDLRGRLVGRAISRVDLTAFSALKTFDPPLHALHGTLVDDVTRHGKFLDVDERAVQRVQRRVERLEGAERGQVDPADRLADQASAQVLDEGFDLRQLGHADESRQIFV